MDPEPSPTTRQLLDAIGSGDERLPDRDPRTVRRFVRWLLAATFLAVVAIGAFNWWIDPLAATGRTTRFVAVENTEVAAGKLDLMEQLARPPEVLLLGSSRSMKLDPADVRELTGASAFNAGISGARNLDTLQYAAYAEELWGSEGFPHLVVGVATDSFRARDDGFATDPRLADLDLSASAAGDDDDGAGGVDVPLLDELGMFKELLSLEALEASLRSVRAEVGEDGPGALLDPVPDDEPTIAADGGTADGRFGPRGMQLYDPFGAELPTEESVEQQLARFVRSNYAEGDTFDGAEQGGIDDFVALVRLANAHGDVPAVWITPFHPRAGELLPRAAEARDRVFRATLADLAAREDIEFTLHDPDSAGGPQLVADDWHDGIHMTQENTRRVLEWLHRDGVLAPPS